MPDDLGPYLAGLAAGGTRIVPGTVTDASVFPPEIDGAATPCVSSYVPVDGDKVLILSNWNGKYSSQSICLGLVSNETTDVQSVSFTPSYTNVTLGTTGLVNAGVIVPLGNRMVELRTFLTLGTGGSFTGNVTLNLPSDYNSDAGGWLAQCYFHEPGVSLPMGHGLVASNSIVPRRGSDGTIVAAAVPFTWSAGDTMIIQATYRLPAL